MSNKRKLIVVVFLSLFFGLGAMGAAFRSVGVGTRDQEGFLQVRGAKLCMPLLIGGRMFYFSTVFENGQLHLIENSLGCLGSPIKESRFEKFTLQHYLESKDNET